MRLPSPAPPPSTPQLIRLIPATPTYARPIALTYTQSFPPSPPTPSAPHVDTCPRHRDTPYICNRLVCQLLPRRRVSEFKNLLCYDLILFQSLLFTRFQNGRFKTTDPASVTDYQYSVVFGALLRSPWPDTSHGDRRPAGTLHQMQRWNRTRTSRKCYGHAALRRRCVPRPEDQLGAEL
jgi:hypothetical protein